MAIVGWIINNIVAVGSCIWIKAKINEVKSAISFFDVSKIIRFCTTTIFLWIVLYVLILLIAIYGIKSQEAVQMGTSVKDFNGGVLGASRSCLLYTSGFTDAVKTNSALVQKRIRDTRLKVKQKTIGKRSQTLVQILYMEDLVRPELLEDLEKRLDSFVIDGVLDSGVIEQLTESSWLSPFPQFQTTERPDKCAAERCV